MTGTAPVRRRLLGSALRKYREDLGFTLDQAARILECDRSKISRIETGQRGIRAKELRELLADYGVADGEQEALLAIAHSGRQNGWWLEYRDVLSEAGQDYVIMELAATEILAYEPNQIPDLLQSPQYASALADADANCTCDDQREHAIEVKLARQRIVLGAHCPKLEVVITEGALRQAVGGVRVMRGQLEWLAQVADAGLVQTLPDGDEAGAGGRARVSLQVLPFAVGAHAAAGCGPMTVLRFAQSQGLGVVHLSGLSGGVSLQEPEEVARYSADIRPASLSRAVPHGVGAAAARHRPGLARVGGLRLHDLGQRYRVDRERKLSVDVIQLRDQVLNIAKLLTVNAHAVAGTHGQALQGVEIGGGLDRQANAFVA